MENLVIEIEKNGFCKIPNNKYGNGDLFDFQASYFRLSKDQAHGERYRAYSKYKYENKELSLENVDFNEKINIGVHQIKYCGSE
ncbi:hypothetical protein SPONN_1501 [uncultured Candidatus Thioglobus sp.]|nr:hypothetical protein SPONN_1501 [uncultured Candidatus Thioglobus sp.]